MLTIHIYGIRLITYEDGGEARPDLPAMRKLIEGVQFDAYRRFAGLVEVGDIPVYAHEDPFRTALLSVDRRHANNAVTVVLEAADTFGRSVDQLEELALTVTQTVASWVSRHMPEADDVRARIRRPDEVASAMCRRFSGRWQQVRMQEAAG